MDFTDENLIAFLLGDASQDLRERIEEALVEENLVDGSDLRDRLAHFRQLLGHMDSLGGIYEPPGDLVESTMERIEEVEAANSVQPAASVGLSVSEGSEKSKGSNARSRIDSIVLTVCLGAVCCLVLPSIVTARFESRKLTCANNLAILGQSVNAFASQDPNGRYPQIGNSVVDGFAGFQLVQLRDNGYEVRPPQVRCASLMGCENLRPEIAIQRIPTFVELKEVAASELRAWQAAIGGDYAYNLGIHSPGNGVVAPKSRGRANYALIADAPVFVDGGEEFIAHDGRGINILYEDGRVQFVSTPSKISEHVGDYPFRNLRDQHAAGLSEVDASLAPSEYSPLAEFR